MLSRWKVRQSKQIRARSHPKTSRLEAGRFITVQIRLLFGLQLSTSIAQAQLVEIRAFKQILPYIRAQSLIVLDLDNTIIEPHQTLGSDEWFTHSIHLHLQAGKDSQTAVHLTAQDWLKVQHSAPMKPVEPETPALIRSIQKAGHFVLGLTARTHEIAPRTIEQLRDISIDFLINPVSSNTLQFDPETETTHHAGIIFVTGPIQKGHALTKFFDHQKLKPEHVIFVDDKQHHAVSVENALKAAEIDHVVFRYGANDHKEKLYRHDIAELQMEYFKREQRLISDEEALEQLR